MKVSRKHLFLALGIIVGVLYLAETTLRILPPGFLGKDQSLISAVSYLRAGKLDISLPGSIYQFRNGSTPFLTLSGRSNRLTLLCENEGHWHTFFSDPFGFSNPAGVWSEKKIETVLLGDSFTLGNCRPHTERFASQIQERIPKTLNLGYRMSGPLMALARLIEYGAQYRPKHVFYFYAEGNDLLDAHREGTTRELLPYLNNPEFRVGIKDAQRHIDRRFEDIEEHQLAMAYLNTPRDFLTLGRVRRAIHLKKETRRNKPVPIEKRVTATYVHPTFFRTLDRIQSLSKSWGGTFHLVYLPSYIPRRRPLSQEILAYANKKKMPVINMLDAFEKNQITPWTGAHPNHYNAQGNLAVSRAVLRHLGYSIEKPRGQSPDKVG